MIQNPRQQFHTSIQQKKKKHNNTIQTNNIISKII
jgi:hypothetical protein